MTIAAARGRADGDEHRLGVRTAAARSAENASRPAATLFRDQRVEPGLDRSACARVQGRQLLGVGVDHGDVGAEFGKAGGGHEADIAAADHRDPHVAASHAIFRRGGNGETFGNGRLICAASCVQVAGCQLPTARKTYAGKVVRATKSGSIGTLGAFGCPTPGRQVFSDDGEFLLC